MDINTINIKSGFKLVEASAGTGKSFTITHIVLRDIIENKVKAEEILLLSFTKNTCNDLREKIIERINQLKFYLISKDNIQADETLISWIENYISINSRNKEDILNNINSFLENVDKLTVTTFHGLCNKILGDYSIELNSIQGYKIENNLDELYLNIIDEIWIDEYLSLDSQLIQTINSKNISTKYKINKINKQLFIKMLKEIDQENLCQLKKNEFINEQSSIYLVNYAQKNWIDFCKLWKKKGNQLFISLIEIGRAISNKGTKSKVYSANPRDKFKIINNWIADINERIKKEGFNNLIPEISKEDLLSNYFYIKSINKEAKRFSINYDHSELEELQKAIYKIKDGIYNEHIRIFIEKSYKRLVSLKDNKCILNYSDLIKTIQNNLINNASSNQNNINIISQKYKSILIDEFQDTDQIQWNIIKKLFNSKEHFLMCVGDPKQAIYKFRGGDLETYLDAKKEADETYTLTRNYRSKSELLDILNSLYKKGLKESKLIYKELKTGKNSKKVNNPKEIFEIVNFSAKKNPIEIYILNYIYDLFKVNKEIDFNKIAILTLYNYQCEALKDLLIKYNLQSKIVTKKNIFDTEAAKILKIFISCLIDFNSIENIKLLATSKFIQMDFDNLNSDYSDEIDILYRKCKIWSIEIKDKGFISLVNELIIDYESPNIILDNDLQNNLFQVSELIEKELINQNYNLNKLFSWYLNELNQNTRKSKNEENLAKDFQNKNRINISTIHSSKGLEFDLVICPYLWDESKNKNEMKGPIWKNNLENEIYINIENSCKRVKEINLNEEKDLANESERLIYVALTRAKSKLVIFNNIDSINNKLNNNLLLNLSSKENFITEKEFVNNDIYFKDIDNVLKNDNLILSPWQNKTLIDKKKNKNNFGNKFLIRSSYSSWIRKDFMNNKNKSERDYEENISILNSSNNPNKSILENKYYSDPNPLSEFPKGKNAGKCLHKIIERFNFRNIESHKLNILIEEELKNHDIDLSHKSQVKESLSRIALTPFGEILNNKRLFDIPKSNIVKEMKFEIPISNQGKIINSEDIAKSFMIDKDFEFHSEYARKVRDLNINSKGFHSGYIDCIFSVGDDYGNNKWWIIDWKSNFISDSRDNKCLPRNYNYENMKEEMLKHHYPLQSHLYLLALHRLLKWRLRDYEPEKHLGGFIYLFIRGLTSIESIKESEVYNSLPGIFLNKAPVNRIQYLDNLFSHGK